MNRGATTFQAVFKREFLEPDPDLSARCGPARISKTIASPRRRSFMPAAAAAHVQTHDPLHYMSSRPCARLRKALREPKSELHAP